MTNSDKELVELFNSLTPEQQMTFLILIIDKYCYLGNNSLKELIVKYKDNIELYII